MFVDSRTNPPGVFPMSGKGRKPIFKVFSGDSVELEMELFSACGAPASPDNCNVEFVLAENQFACAIWTGEWWNGVKPDENRPGLVHVRIPEEVTKSLRRGSYMFSARVSDLTGYEFSTQEEGYLLVEYAPTSEHRSIPYRDGTSEKFKSGGSDGCSEKKDAGECGCGCGCGCNGGTTDASVGGCVEVAGEY